MTQHDPAQPQQPNTEPATTPADAGTGPSASADPATRQPTTPSAADQAAKAAEERAAKQKAAEERAAKERAAAEKREKAAAKQEAREKKLAEMTPEERDARRRRRGALAAGGLSMPIIALGATLMAVPLGIWYVSTVLKTVIVVITNMVTGERQAAQVNGALNNVDPGAMSSFSMALIIIGAVLIIAALLISYFMLRAHDVRHPILVTVFSMPLASVIAVVVSASIGALGGLIFRDATQTVSGILANAAFGIAGFALAVIAVSVVIGGAAWWWVSGIFRRIDVKNGD